MVIDRPTDRPKDRSLVKRLDWLDVVADSIKMQLVVVVGHSMGYALGPHAICASLGM